MQLGEDTAAAAAAWWGERLEKRSEVTAVQRQEETSGQSTDIIKYPCKIYCIYISYIHT